MNHQKKFLDVKIDVKNDKFNLSVFDKTRKFDFKVIKLPHGDSLIPKHIKINAGIGEVRRTISICASFNLMCREVGLLLRNVEINNAINCDKVIRKLGCCTKTPMPKFGLNNTIRRKLFIHKITATKNVFPLC